MKKFSKIEIFFLLLFSFLTCVISIKITAFHVPRIVNEGKEVKIICLYQTEQNTLYNVKWYKDDKEFYTYNPKRMPHTMVYNSGGVKVDLTKSHRGMVVLRKVNLTYSGDYLCEASEESPYFHTKKESGKMEVVALPKKNPTITLKTRWYSLGDPVIAECSTEKSKPQVKLSWFINDILVPKAIVEETKPEFDQYGRSSFISTLKFTANKDYVSSETGEIFVRCSATALDRSAKRQSNDDIIKSYEKVSQVVIYPEKYSSGSMISSMDNGVKDIKIITRTILLPSLFLLVNSLL